MVATPKRQLTDDERREKRRPKACRRCRRPHGGDVYVSFRGLCSECSTAAVTQSIVAMASKSGPEYERWKAKMRAYADRELSA